MTSFQKNVRVKTKRFLRFHVSHLQLFHGADTFDSWYLTKAPVNASPYYPFYWFPPPFTTESVYDLLPRELQLPSSTQQSPKVMSQKSGGEAGSLPSASLASGRILLLLTLFLLCEQDWLWPTPSKKNVQLTLQSVPSGKQTPPSSKKASQTTIMQLWFSCGKNKKRLEQDVSGSWTCLLPVSACCCLLYVVVSCSNSLKL